MRLGPGISFSWKRAVGLSGLRQRLARRIGVPTTRQGLERKVGAQVLGCLLPLFPLLIFILAVVCALGLVVAASR